MNTRKLDDAFMNLELEADALTSIAFALQEAFERGDGDADTYNPGFWKLTNLMHDFADKLHAAHAIMDEKEARP